MDLVPGAAPSPPARAAAAAARPSTCTGWPAVCCLTNRLHNVPAICDSKGAFTDMQVRAWSKGTLGSRVRTAHHSKHRLTPAMLVGRTTIQVQRVRNANTIMPAMQATKSHHASPPAKTV